MLKPNDTFRVDCLTWTVLATWYTNQELKSFIAAANDCGIGTVIFMRKSHTGWSIEGWGSTEDNHKNYDQYNCNGDEQEIINYLESL